MTLVVPTAEVAVWLALAVVLVEAVKVQDGLFANARDQMRIVFAAYKERHGVSASAS